MVPESGDDRAGARHVPRIGVTGPDRGGFGAWLATWLALARVGAQAVRITPRRGLPDDALDGFVIGGGADVGWQQWESVPEGAGDADRRLLDLILFPLIALLRLLTGKRQRAADNAARDRLELSCLELARAARKPVLGICRGAQLVNVFLGGRLRRDLAAFYEEGRAVSSVLPRKRIFIEPDSGLARALGRTHCRVNALHRQAIDDRHLGEGLVVVAHEASGVVQAVESNGPWRVLGVQWHPEYMPQRREQLGLFASLVAQSDSRHGAQ